ncbi:hypothetical protein V2J09_002267 [Rumex salicifolius]
MSHGNAEIIQKKPLDPKRKGKAKPSGCEVIVTISQSSSDPFRLFLNTTGFLSSVASHHSLNFRAFFLLLLQNYLSPYLDWIDLLGGAKDPASSQVTFL